MSNETTTTGQLGWGFLSTSNIGRKLKKTIDLSKNGKVVAIASRSKESAQKYINEISTPDEKITAYGSYEDLFQDPNVNVVYVPLPSALKKEWCIKAAQHKKHVLCEKPFVSAEEVEEITKACQENGVSFLDGTMFVHNPRTQLIRDLLKSGELGDITHVNSEFCWYQEESETNPRTIKELEPMGALGDLGWYTSKSILVSYGFELPQKVVAFAQKKKDTIFRVHATLWFSNNRMATLTSSFEHSVHQLWKISGTQKTLIVDGFVVPWTSEPIYFPEVKELDELDVSIRSSSGLVDVKKVPLNGVRQEVRMVEELVRLAQLRNQGQPEIETENRWIRESIATQKLLDSIYKSIQTNGVVTL